MKFDKYNLLSLWPLKRLVTSRAFPYFLQVIVLIFFLFFIIIGWGLFAPEGTNDKLFAKVNIVNLAIWGLWWPVMVWIAVLFGRVWCAICPLEIVGYWMERLAYLFGFRQRKLPKVLISGGIIVLLYALIQMLVAGIHLHRIPAYTSVFLLTLFAMAVVTGFLFKDRPFCRGFCPVGVLLSVYGRGSMLAVRPSMKKTDANGKRDKLKGYQRPDCPSLLKPLKLASSSDCLLCSHCIKTYSSGKMQLVLRPLFSIADKRDIIASWPVTMFIMLLSGFVTYELTSEWKGAKALFLYVPEKIAEFLSMDASFGWIKGVYMLSLFPVLLWFFLGIIVLFLKGAGGIFEAWRKLALPLAVVISSGHMAKGLAKIASWGCYLPYAISEPTGKVTSAAFTGGSLVAPENLLSIKLISIISLVLMILMAYFALRESWLSDKSAYKSRIIPIFFMTVFYGIIIFGWGFF